MSNDKERIDTLEHVLTQAHRARADGSSNRVDVISSVMREVQHISGRNRSRLLSALPGEFIWRTATIAATVVLLMTVLTVQLLRPGARENADVWAEEFEVVSLLTE
jgi:hypothetical protein